MPNDPQHGKLDELEARIREAEKKPGADEGAAEPVKASQTGYELVGTILVCMLIGWLIDRYLHTKPWGIIGMLLVGFVAGFANVWRTLNGYDRSVGLHKKDGE